MRSSRLNRRIHKMAQDYTGTYEVGVPPPEVNKSNRMEDRRSLKQVGEMIFHIVPLILHSIEETCPLMIIPWCYAKMVVPWLLVAHIEIHTHNIFRSWGFFAQFQLPWNLVERSACRSEYFHRNKLRNKGNPCVFNNWEPQTHQGDLPQTFVISHHGFFCHLLVNASFIALIWSLIWLITCDNYEHWSSSYFVGWSNISKFHMMQIDLGSISILTFVGALNTPHELM